MKDRIGEKYGRIEIISFDKRINRTYYWNCKCECGNVKSIRSTNLTSKKTNSCGCLGKESRAKSNTKHGHSFVGKHSTEYNIWTSMTQRCTNIKNDNYPNYGAKGIKICERWIKFENFLEDMGQRPSKKYTLDRIDTKGNYELINCRWATSLQQNNNTSRNVKVKNLITDEEYTSIAVAAREINISETTLWYQLTKAKNNKTNLTIIK